MDLPLRSAAFAPARALTPRRRTLGLLVLLALAVPLVARPAPLAAVPARAGGTEAATAFDGVVEAVRQTVVAAQVPGAVVELRVKAGDRVASGQVLLRLDARAADQSAAASDAQVLAARAGLDVAARDVERQRQLFRQNFISQAALDQAEAAFKATQAQVNAQLAQAGAARTQTSFYVVRAPFAGVVSEVPVSLGDMAMPGRALLTLYDPTALRVTAAVPQSFGAGQPPGRLPRIEFAGPAAAPQWVQPVRVQWLPTADPATHTVQVRADLPAGSDALAPGLYARVWLAAPSSGQASPQAAGQGPARTTGQASVRVPRTAVVRRAEVAGLYVLDASGRPMLRQVRLGRVEGEEVEVLSGLAPGELVAVDPQAAARAVGR